MHTREEVSTLIKAYDVRGIVPQQLNADTVYEIGYAFGVLMRIEGATRVVLGHDMRSSSPELARGFAAGVIDTGLDVFFIGLISTDGLYFASGKYDCPGAMFTASHNPAQYNGIKLCRAGAKPVGQDSGLGFIGEFLVSQSRENLTPLGTSGKIIGLEVLDDYADYMVEKTRFHSCRPLKIVIDAGNGMAGLTAPAVMSRLAGMEYIPMYFELDGSFPNHEANPLVPENIYDLQLKVVEEHADLGLAFDGDADRCFFVDEQGNAISPSAITALVAVRELVKHPESTILYNLITSRAVPEIIKEHGGIPVKTRVGHSFIKTMMAQTGAVFGGEHSAHYYFQDFFGADSGMFAALHVIGALASQNEPISQLVRNYTRFNQSGEINSRVENPGDTVNAIRAAFAASTESVDTLDGITVNLTDGSWFNVRASNTEPLLRLNVEGSTQEQVEKLTHEVLAIIEQ